MYLVNGISGLVEAILKGTGFVGNHLEQIQEAGHPSVIYPADYLTFHLYPGLQQLSCHFVSRWSDAHSQQDHQKIWIDLCTIALFRNLWKMRKQNDQLLDPRRQKILSFLQDPSCYFSQGFVLNSRGLHWHSVHYVLLTEEIDLLMIDKWDWNDLCWKSAGSTEKV